MTKLEIESLMNSMESVLEMIPDIPEDDCRCHILPPCNDCVENGGLRNAVEEFRKNKELFIQREKDGLSRLQMVD